MKVKYSEWNRGWKKQNVFAFEGNLEVFVIKGEKYLKKKAKINYKER